MFTRSYLRALVEGGLSQAHEVVVQSLLPRSAHVTFQIPPEPSTEPEIPYNHDPEFLFGGFELPDSFWPSGVRPTQYTGSLSDEQKAKRQKDAELRARGVLDAYGPITERRDVFFEKAEKTGNDEYSVFAMPLSVLDSSFHRSRKR